MQKKILICVMLFALTSCNLLCSKASFKSTKINVDLGSVGVEKRMLSNVNYYNFGNPAYYSKIKLDVSRKYFNKQVYKQYLNSSINRSDKIKLIYHDSLKVKPSYVEITIQDHISVVNQLNDLSKVKAYLKEYKNSRFIGAVRLLVDNNLLSLLNKSDSFYLKTDSYNKQWIYLHKDSKEIGRVEFPNNSVFQYNTYKFCWKIVDEKIQLSTINRLCQKCNFDNEDNVKKLQNKIDSKKNKLGRLW